MIHRIQEEEIKKKIQLLKQLKVKIKEEMN